MKRELTEEEKKEVKRLTEQYAAEHAGPVPTSPVSDWGEDWVEYATEKMVADLHFKEGYTAALSSLPPASLIEKMAGALERAQTVIRDNRYFSALGWGSDDDKAREYANKGIEMELITEALVAYNQYKS